MELSLTESEVKEVLLAYAETLLPGKFNVVTGKEYRSIAPVRFEFDDSLLKADPA